MFKNKEVLSTRMNSIIEEIKEWREILDLNEQLMNDEYKRCLDEGISTQPACIDEMISIAEAEENIAELKKEHKELARQFVNDFGPVPTALLLPENEHHLQNEFSPSQTI